MYNMIISIILLYQQYYYIYNIIISILDIILINIQAYNVNKTLQKSR